MSRSDLGQRSARGAFWATVEVWGIEFLQFLVFAALARLLGPEAFGLVGLAMIPILVANVFLAQGGWIEFVVQCRNLEQQHLETIFWAIIGIGATLGVTVVLTAPLLAEAFNESQLEALVLPLCVCPVIISLTVLPIGLLQRDLNLAPLALRSTLAMTVGGTVGIAMAIAGYGVWSLVAYEIALPLVGAVVLWRALKWRPRLRFSIAHLRQAIRFSTRVLGERLINLTEVLVPRAIIGGSLGAGAVGHWTLARKIFDLSAELVQRPALRVALPRFALAQREPAELSQILALAVELTALVTVPGYVALGLMAPEMVALSFGEGWRPAGHALMLFAMLGLITPLTQLSIAVLHGTGRVGWTLLLSATGFALLLLLLPAGLTHGIVGVAGAFLIRGWVLLGARLWVLRRKGGVCLGALPRAFAPSLAAGAVMAAVMGAAEAAWSESLAESLQLPLVLSLGVTSYLLVLMLIARDRVVRAIALGRRVVGLGRTR